MDKPIKNENLMFDKNKIRISEFNNDKNDSISSEASYTMEKIFF